MKAIFVLNAGSSSLKFRIFEDVQGLPLILKGQISGIGDNSRVYIATVDATLVDESSTVINHHADALAYVREWLTHFDTPLEWVAFGHRVVHGGRDFDRAVIVSAAVMSQLEELVPLAPLHQPHNLAAMRAVARDFPDVLQVACFDTAFHRGHNKLAEQFALPQQYYDRGVRRYGFHGLSYEYICRQAETLCPDVARGKMIIAHLGNGASLCAVEKGASIESTMSFTALDGLPMGTRCGALDPGAVLYMMQHDGLDATQIEDILYRRSGLLGLSGISNDMRVLLQSSAPAARQAIDYFVYRVVAEIGALAAILGGVDALIFTAGIGENAAPIRQAVCDRLVLFQLEIDDDANARCAGDCRISSPGSALPVWVIGTNEERMIARHTSMLAQEM